MKTLVAVDRSQACRTAALLAARLSFAPPRTMDLVHVVEPLTPLMMGNVPPDPTWLARWLQDQEAIGRDALKQCESALRAADVDVSQTTMRQGPVALEILAATHEAKSDLLAAGCEQIGALERFFLGSVSRKLLSAAPCSVLLGKATVLPERPLKAVFATDHSPYAGRALELLARLEPAGIGELTIVSAYTHAAASLVGSTLPQLLSVDIERWFKERLNDENHRAMRRLSRLPAKLSSRVLALPPVEAIRAVLDETAADLVIVGAHGHGFVDRMLLGSVSHELAVRDPRHVLVLRP